MRMVACTSCVHLREERNSEEERTCDAFPDGIPEMIVFGEHQHRTPVDGDHGIRWKPVEGMEWLDVPMPEGESGKSEKAT